MYSITDSVLQEGNSSIFKIFHKQARNSDSLHIKENEFFFNRLFSNQNLIQYILPLLSD